MPNAYFLLMGWVPMPRIDLDSSAGQEQALREMLRIRLFEEAVQENFADGEIPRICPFVYRARSGRSGGVCGA